MILLQQPQNGHLGYRELHHCPRSLAGFTFEIHLSLHQFGNLPCNGNAQPGSMTIARFIHSVETLPSLISDIPAEVIAEALWTVHDRSSHWPISQSQYEYHTAVHCEPLLAAFCLMVSNMRRIFCRARTVKSTSCRFLAIRTTSSTVRL